MGNVGRFRSSSPYARGARTVCRTARGLELGEVMGPVDSGEADGDVIRRMTQEDQLLEARLRHNADDAFAACQQLLDELACPPALLDVELMFDGQGLFFYFLGDVPAQVDAMTADLALAYEAHAQIARFTETLESGCGPECGTEEASGGCGSGNCSSCAVVEACKK
jgi:cell fate regulator YaaT (PSP1 superfamily)